MNRWGAALVLVTATALGVRAETGTLMRALNDELGRTTSRLRMEQLAPPYFAAYTVEEDRRLEIRGAFGALKGSNVSLYRNVKVDVRVGSAEFDNTHYVGRDYWNYDTMTQPLIVEDDYDALRFDLWRLTDDAYKHALQRFSHKKAYKQSRMIRDEIPDLTRDPAQSSQRGAARPELRRELWETRMSKVSAVFKDYPAIESSDASLFWTDRTVYLADSEGRRSSKPADDYEIYITANAQAVDGMGLSDYRRFIRRRADDLPPYSLLEAEALQLARGLTALTKAPLFAEDYIGPVLFEDQAAGEFFNQLLARNVSFPRELWLEDESAREKFHKGELTERLGLRVISPLISVEDDPSLEAFEGVPLIGHYAVDDEGIPAERVQLIERGILKDLPTSRAPTKKSLRSNGHSRGALWEIPTAHISNMIVWAEKTSSMEEIKQDLLARARDFGLDHAYIVRRLVMEEGREAGELLAPPIMLYRVDAESGEETLVRNAKFSGVTLRALRDIVAVSSRRHVHNFYQLGPFALARGQTQASIIHPSILVSEMELKRTDKKPVKLPYLKHPHFN
ncbi:MAG: metallopeptidase TldD-related protein [Elusimicrobiota bacterium]